MRLNLRESTFSQWVESMRMVIRLPGGIPGNFRKKLWSTLSEKYLEEQHVEWSDVYNVCFDSNSNLLPQEVEEQVEKDLHRTGCDMFVGENGQQHRTLLRQVLLAFGRWNTTIGYCQGFHMLGAMILEVMDWDVEECLKVMIFLIEGVLPSGYFTDGMKGLFVDMKVLRELLGRRHPALSSHFEQLQNQDTESGRCNDPALINIQSTQWFLTLFVTIFPKSLVLRFWDFILLEGNEALFRISIEIWDFLGEEIMSVENAEQFYGIMSDLNYKLLEMDEENVESLVEMISFAEPFPVQVLSKLRQKYSPKRRRSSLLVILNKGIELDLQETNTQTTNNNVNHRNDEVSTLDNDKRKKSKKCLKSIKMLVTKAENNFKSYI